MYKYVIDGNKNVHIKTPKVDSFADIKKDIKQFPDRIESHLEYPNGLVLDIITYAGRIEYTSNKKLIVQEDLSIAFEE